MSARLTSPRSRGVPRSSIVPHRNSIVIGAACFAVILFSLVPATTRIATAQLSGLSIGLIRTTGAGLLAIPLLIVLRLRLPQGFKNWSLLLAYAVGNFAAFPILFAIGVHRTSGSHAALIMAALPLFVGLLGMAHQGRLPHWRWFIGAAIAIGGEVALVRMGNASSSSAASVAGDATVFAACTLSAFGIFAGALLGSRTRPLAATLWAIAIAGVTLAPWGAFRLIESPQTYQHLTGITWAAILQITLGAAVIANVTWLWAVARGGLVRIAPIQFAQPVCALLFAGALLNEHLSPALILVGASIIIGTITACRGAKPKPTTNERDPATLPFLKDAPSLVPPDPERIRALIKFVQRSAHIHTADRVASELELVRL